MSFDDPAVIWGIAGLALLVLEMFTNTFFALFCGIACLLTAILTHFVFDNHPLYSWISFVVLSVILVAVLLKPLKKKFGNNAVKSSFEDHIGKKVKVIYPILENSQGKVYYKGTEWLARCEDPTDELKLGAVVEIVAVEGNNLIVRR